MGTLLRRVDSFRRYREDDSNSLKILTSPRRMSLEAAFIFQAEETVKNDEMLNVTVSHQDVATGQASASKDEKVPKHSPTRTSKNSENIDDLLKEERFKPQLEFERKFLQEYSRRRRSEADEIAAEFVAKKEISAEFVAKKENKLPDDLKRYTSSNMFDSAFPCPQFEYCVSSRLKREHIPAYWLTCAYKFVSTRKHLNIVIRQTGTLPDIKDSKLSASVVIDGQKDKQRIVLAKSQNDKSFKSHEIVFNEQTLADLQKKMLSVKLYIHSKPFTKKRVAEWKFELANVCAKEKIECKRFVFSL